MPDLSFYPENYLVQAAIEDPVAFGQARQRQIAELVKIADLSLLDFEQARNDLERALSSEEPWQRYWGAIVCSCFGQAAEPLTMRLQQLAADDPEPLARVRAAEFLGLTAQADPRPAIMAALAASESSEQANLILNSVILLRDGPPGYDFTVTPESLHPRTRDDQEVKRRLEYLGAAGSGVGRP
jgi:HEAT repeat protein